MGNPAGSIIIKPGEAGRLIVVLPYNPEPVAKIKTIPGRRWHQEERYWTVPDEQGMRERLQALFAESTPEARRSEGPPRILERLRQAIQARHFSRSTEKTYAF